MIFSKIRHVLALLTITTSICNASAEFEADSSRYLNAGHLTSYSEHVDFLHQALSEAKRSVMITSYTISPEMLFGQRIDQSIVDACNRGVKIYIYYKNLSFYKESELRQLELFSGYCERFDQNDNHAKCIAVDETKVAIGSYNWLSERNQRTLNSSFVVTGTLVKGLIQDVWQGIRFYQNLKHGNKKGIASFCRDRDAFSTGAYEFSPGEFYYTLRTPEAHSILFEDEVIKKAKSRVVIFSPFIRLNKLREILSRSNLKQLEDRGVKMHLLTLPDPCRAALEKTEIFNYLEQAKQGYFHFSYSTHYDLHAKTIIADDLLCEGSFNLLSAVDNIDHSANNFEMSVAIRGKIAIPFIEAFYHSELGLKAFPLASFFVKRKKPSFSVKQLEFKSSKSLSFSSIGASSAAASSGGMRGVASSSTSSLVFPKILSPMRGVDIKIFSGARFNRQGFCVRIEGQYIKNSRGAIAYFKSREEAKSVAQKHSF